MNILGLPEIKKTGINLVEKWLYENGYSNILPESIETDEGLLRATGSLENLLLQIRTGVFPQEPEKLSEKEIDLLTTKANYLKMIAYAAYVVIGFDGKIVGEITWQRLN
jgi:hypothetical protein